MLNALSVKISDSTINLPAVDSLIVLSAYYWTYTLYNITVSVFHLRMSRPDSADSSLDSSVFGDLLLLLTSAQLTPTLAPRHTHTFVRILCDQKASLRHLVAVTLKRFCSLS